ncbi:MAG: hypothetical protein O7E52_07835, partial [Candidatus Poribacteria bacterium]|nr:hypothetical protein [Candidatus Poribacteria bacterium]
NSYLALQNEAPVNDDHPAVEAIHRWVEAEYESGRNDPISDDEMLLQVELRLNQGEAVSLHERREIPRSGVVTI